MSTDPSTGIPSKITSEKKLIITQSFDSKFKILTENKNKILAHRSKMVEAKVCMENPSFRPFCDTMLELYCIVCEMQEWPSEDWELQEYEISIKDFLVEMEPFQPWNFKKMTATLGNLKTLGNDLQKMSSLYAEQEELSHNDPESHRTSSLPLRVNDKTPLQADPDPSFLMDPHTVGYFYELQRLQMRYKSMQEDIFRAHKDLELERKRFAARQESYEKELKLHRQVLKETRETAKRKDVHF